MQAPMRPPIPVAAIRSRWQARAEEVAAAAAVQPLPGKAVRVVERVLPPLPVQAARVVQVARAVRAQRPGVQVAQDEAAAQAKVVEAGILLQAKLAKVAQPLQAKAEHLLQAHPLQALVEHLLQAHPLQVLVQAEQVEQAVPAALQPQVQAARRG